METTKGHSGRRGQKVWLILSVLFVFAVVFLGIMSTAVYVENLGTISISGETVVFSLKNSEVAKNAMDGLEKMAYSNYSALQSTHHQLVENFMSQKTKLRLSATGLIACLIAAGCCFARHRKLKGEQTRQQLRITSGCTERGYRRAGEA